MIAGFVGAALFYVFAAVLIVSAAMVVTSRNPVYSVLFLVLAFFNAAGLFLLSGAEFLALLLVIVYVGAVAVLFLFVVMMLDVNFAELRSGFQRYAPVGAAVGIVLLVELGLSYGGWKISPSAQNLLATPTPDGVTNTDALGRVIYTDYLFLFQAAGLILLVAMIGAIVLTLRDKRGSRKQDITRQQERSVAETLEVVQVAIGTNVASLGIRRPLPPKRRRPVHEDVHGHGAHDDAVEGHEAHGHEEHLAGDDPGNPHDQPHDEHA